MESARASLPRSCWWSWMPSRRPACHCPEITSQVFLKVSKLSSQSLKGLEQSLPIMRFVEDFMSLENHLIGKWRFWLSWLPPNISCALIIIYKVSMNCEHLRLILRFTDFQNGWSRKSAKYLYPLAYPFALPSGSFMLVPSMQLSFSKVIISF